MLDNDKINWTTLSDDYSFRVPVPLDDDESRYFLLVIRVESTHTLTMLNSDGSPFAGNYIFDKDTEDPIMSVSEATAGDIVILTFQEVGPNMFHISKQISVGTVSIRQVVFNSMGGSAVDTRYVVNGSTVKSPTVPTKADKQFYWWSTVESGDIEYDFSTPVTSDMTLYAKWIDPEICTITYDTQGGSNPIPKSVSVYKGSYLTDADRPNDPIKPQYVFSGWYKNADGTIPFSFSDRIEESMTIYSKWISQSDPDVEYWKI